jgi:hypothetical protein
MTMRNLCQRGILCIFLASFVFLASTRAASVTLAWDPSPDELVSGYKVYYSVQDFSVPDETNSPIAVIDAGREATVTITDLVGGQIYFFSVVSIGPGVVESELSTVLAYNVPLSSIPQLPPPDGSTNTGSTNTGQISTSTEVSLLGMIPRLWLYPSNGIAMLAIQGAVGATFTIQSSTDPGLAGSWVTITNITLSNPAPNASAPNDNTLQRAFVPALEAFPDPSPMDGTFRYYRIYMPLGFPILAQQVLAQQGYNPRLVAVRSPGQSAHVVCYLAEEEAYLDYNNQTYVAKLVPSGPTIREIANTFAAALDETWTSASEFTLADDGTKFLFATVLQIDDPLTDPPLGIPRASGSDILIDF